MVRFVRGTDAAISAIASPARDRRDYREIMALHATPRVLVDAGTRADAGSDSPGFPHRYCFDLSVHTRPAAAPKCSISSPARSRRFCVEPVDQGPWDSSRPRLATSRARALCDQTHRFSVDECLPLPLAWAGRRCVTTLRPTSPVWQSDVGGLRAPVRASRKIMELVSPVALMYDRPPLSGPPLAMRAGRTRISERSARAYETLERCSGNLS